MDVTVKTRFSPGGRKAPCALMQGEYFATRERLPKAATAFFLLYIPPGILANVVLRFSISTHLL
ncbi:hypothetical protein [Pararhizobium sp. A13]|uniref:hypothetical protein n=1 Tax=Pararhizobium sp. A13 TaxID=3133975 RepID=UPI00324620A8